jgi:hypothetical protein
MAITAADLKFYLSGGAANTDPDASLGGDISTTEITTDVLNNLFDKVTGDEANDGDTEYRGFYVKNAHGSLTLESAVVWILTNTPGGDSVEIGKEATKGSGKQTITNESTAPTTVSFVTAVDKANGLALGDLSPGDVYLIWVKRIVPASCAVYDSDYFEAKFEGDTAA